MIRIDPITSQHVRLYHPRNDAWREHFEWNGPELVGRTPVARATILVLQINRPDRILLRAALIEEGIRMADGLNC